MPKIENPDMGVALEQYVREHPPTSDRFERALDAEALLEGRWVDPLCEAALHLAVNGHTKQAGAAYQRYWSLVCARDKAIRKLLGKTNRQLQHAKAAGRNMEKPRTERFRKDVIEALKRLIPSTAKPLRAAEYTRRIRRELRVMETKERTIRRIVTEYLAPK